MRRTANTLDMGGQGQTDVLRLRRELIQAKSQLGDLQEELDEKTNLYMNSIKVSTTHPHRCHQQRHGLLLLIQIFWWPFVRQLNLKLTSFRVLSNVINIKKS